MKRMLLLMLLFVATIATSQIVNIPDANFKTKLLQASLTNGTAKDSAGANMVVDANGDGQIQETEAQAVYTLNLAYAGIANMTGIQSFTNLTNLICKNNTALTSLDLAGMANLTVASVEYNALTMLNVSGCTGLQNLTCWVNQLTSLDLTGLTSLGTLYCSNNQLAVLDLSPVNLTNLVAGSNPFTTLDLSTQTALEYFNIHGCPNLTSFYAKNGHTDHFDVETFGPCYNLTYVCVDEGEYDLAYNAIADYAQFDTQLNIESIEFSTICSVNGEENNTITGTVHFDGNANGCDSSDPASPLVKVTALHNGNTSSIWTSPSGYYNFAADTGDYQLSLDLQGLQYFAQDGATAPLVSFSALDGTIVTQDFCVVPVGEHNDLEVNVGAYGGIIAGNDQHYWLTYKNSGNQVLNGTVSLSYNDDALDFVTASTASSNTATGLLSWDFSDLQPFQSRTIVLTLHVNTATSTPPVELGDILDFSFVGSIAPDVDDTPENNQLGFSQVVYASQDPNNIVCLEGASLPSAKIGEYLHYTVNFENIGTAAADFVVVINEISADEYDVNSVEILGSSHAVAASQVGNILTFRFDDIALAPDAYGSVTFKIKSLASLQEGDAVMSQANIVFDYNEALVTNQASTVFVDAAGIKDFSADTVKVYPNPASDIVKISSLNPLQSIAIYDIRGRELLVQPADAITAELNIGSQPTGIYIIKIKTDAGTVTQKLVKK